MKRIIVTLDLDSKKNPAYETLNKLMTDLGFSDISPKRELDLPHNTYYGTISDDIGIKRFRAKLWRRLKIDNLHPKALFGGELKDWAMIRKRK